MKLFWPHIKAKGYPLWLKTPLAVFIVLIGLAGILSIGRGRAVAPASEAPQVETVAEIEAAPVPTPEETKQEIVKAPPKIQTSGTSSVSTKADGTKAVTVSTGPTSPADTAVAAAAGPSASITGIDYIDQTGLHPELGDQLKAFMSSSLLVKGEVSGLYSIILKNAGDTGWAGTYAGSYTQGTNGTITSAWGYITLNSYYYEGNPRFSDYMKLILSHEYGHHYTLYYKWVVWQLPYGERFPASYYTARALPEATTAPDYSKGWGNCDAEIAAEDYSYLYSGYGLHGMSATYGYPSATVRSWLVNEPNGPGTPVVVDSPPSVTISAPADGATISGDAPLSATASDDVGITKVVFYIGSTKLAEDLSSPYSTALASTEYGNGTYALKARAYDSAGQTTDASISVTINNATSDLVNPTVSITDPSSNPHSWTSGNLYIKATANDNIAIQKIELYINDILVATESLPLIERNWAYIGTPSGIYTLKAKAYDTSGNTAETSITINKT